MKQFFAVLSWSALVLIAGPIIAQTPQLGGIDFVLANGESGGDFNGEQGGDDGGEEGGDEGGSAPGPSGPTSTGGHAGSSTKTIIPVIVALIEFVQGTSYDQASFNMSDKEPPVASINELNALKPNTKQIICRAQQMLNRHQDFARGKLMAANVISQLTGESLSAVYTALRSNSFCSSSQTAKAATSDVVEIEYQITMVLDSEGVPVSSNPVWNACLRDTVYRDPETGYVYNCRRGKYHSRARWYHPDIQGLAFTWNARRPWALKLPENVRVVTVVEDLSQSELIALATELNQREAIGPLVAQVEEPKRVAYNPLLTATRRAQLIATRPVNAERVSRRTTVEVVRQAWLTAKSRWLKVL